MQDLIDRLRGLSPAGRQRAALGDAGDAVRREATVTFTARGRAPKRGRR